jgi:hypothetical protein
VRTGNLHSGRKGERAAGHIKGVWHELGGEAGTRTIGVRRIEVAPEQLFDAPAAGGSRCAASASLCARRISIIYK